MKIEVFGIGCESCKLLEENAKTAVRELGISAEIIKVDDFEVLIRRGITATPGLAIDGKVVALGRVPNVEEIKEIIGESKAGTIVTPPSSANEAKGLSCGCSSNEIMIYACSGGSNVGQASNEAAKMLVRREQGKFSCLAGVSAKNDMFIERAKKAKVVLAIDGCGVKCALRTLERAGIHPTVTIVITDLGIKKDTSVLTAEQSVIEATVGAIEERIRQLP